MYTADVYLVLVCCLSSFDDDVGLREVNIASSVWLAKCGEHIMMNTKKEQHAFAAAFLAAAYQFDFGRGGEARIDGGC